MTWYVFLEPVLELHLLSLLGQDTRKACTICFHQCIQGGMQVKGGRGVVQREHMHRMGLRQKQSDQPAWANFYLITSCRTPAVVYQAGG